jgi:pimeloyl-ACP methyl ester carboxylesterase
MLFFGDKFEQNKIFELDQCPEILNQPEFDNSKSTVLYIHGYLETPEVESIHVIVDAYQKRNDHNILILDWGELADGSYVFEALPNAIKLGEVLAEQLLNMINHGLDINKLHIVGHSLGGQLSGMIGRKVKSKSKNKVTIKRISALDPAFPPFYPGILFTHLNKKDADFVDVIHTDAWLYGAPFSTGTVDFWPNKGKTLQPGCPKRNYKFLTDNDLCSHRRSWWFWAESVSNKNEKSFPAIKCKSWRDFKAARCDQGSPIAYMGIDCPTDVKGDYYLQTNGESPYSKGNPGIAYIPIKK